jgi:gamma-glutamyltranspeptidase/glutathione hydrolase
MIAAANPLAARAGLEILREGGSAVDAAIAAQMVLTLVEPQSSGIGGGAFLLNYTPRDAKAGTDARIRAYDGRETAPAAATENLFLNASGQPYPLRAREAGGRGVGVPGALRMLELAHRNHGRLPWKRLFQPAIQLARDGFKVSPRLHALIARDRHLRSFAATRKYFITEEGAALPVGTLLRNPALADSLAQIAEGGADAFHKGDIARDIAAAVQGTHVLPGQMTQADLARYQAKERPVLCRPYRNWRVCGMPPPTSGGVATLQILGMLEKFDMSRIEAGSMQAVHLMSEASRLAFADRNHYLADSDFVPVPVDGLLDRDYLASRARMISAVRASKKAYPGSPPRLIQQGLSADTDDDRHISTSHISVVDRYGSAISMTTSVGMPFGSRLMARGFMLNDQLTDFSPLPRKDGRPIANRAGPGKRPRSSMSPTIVTDPAGNLVMVIGSPGGSSIIAYVLKTLIGALDWNLSMADAIALPNHANKNGRTNLENATVLVDYAPALRALGHKLRIRRMTSGLHGIRVHKAGIRDKGGLEGAADPRREGVALGD